MEQGLLFPLAGADTAEAANNTVDKLTQSEIDFIHFHCMMWLNAFFAPHADIHLMEKVTQYAAHFEKTNFKVDLSATTTAGKDVKSVGGGGGAGKGR